MDLLIHAVFFFVFVDISNAIAIINHSLWQADVTDRYLQTPHSQTGMEGALGDLKGRRWIIPQWGAVTSRVRASG